MAILIDVFLYFLVLWSNMLVKCAKNELMTLNRYPQQTFQLMLDLTDMLHEEGYTANALGDLSAGTHAFGMNRRAHSCFKHLTY